MNVMKKAHQLTRAYFTYFKGTSDKYAAVLKRSLRQAHKEFKAMTATVKVSDIKEFCAADTNATDFVIEGAAVDSEGESVYINFATGNEGSVQKEAEYYLNLDNGFTNVEMTLEMYYHGKPVKEFKITK